MNKGLQGVYCRGQGILAVYKTRDYKKYTGEDKGIQGVYRRG